MTFGEAKRHTAIRQVSIDIGSESACVIIALEERRKELERQIDSLSRASSPLPHTIEYLNANIRLITNLITKISLQIVR